MRNDEIAAAKRRAADLAVEAVDDGMTVGLGSGSTAAAAIRALGRRVDTGLDIEGVPTSFQSREVATEAGVPIREPEDVEEIDLAIDGADQVAGPHLVKGGGGAHAREKLIDAAATRFLVVVDDRKRSTELDHSVPVEVLPDARTLVAESIDALGGEPDLRRAQAKSGPIVTDNGNLILDCDFGEIDDPPALATSLSGVPGVVEHGLFVGMVDTVYVGTEADVEVVTP